MRAGFGQLDVVEGGTVLVILPKEQFLSLFQQLAQVTCLTSIVV